MQHRWLALFAAITASFMTLLDVSIVNVALPTMGNGLHAQASELQWVVSGYALAFGVVPIIGGRLGDDFGRKQVLLVGTVIFVVSSAAVGFAPNVLVLIIARLIQGLAGGLLNPQVSGVIQQLFGREERGKGFAALGINIGVATAAGPTIGGLLIAAGGDHWGWRLCFLVNLPIGIFSTILCQRLLPAQATRGSRRSGLDLPGAALLALGLFCVLFPLVEFDSRPDPALALLFIPAVVLLGAFWLWERKPAVDRGHPLIDVSLFGIPSFNEGFRLALFYLAAYTGSPLVLSLFLQYGLGFSALRSGLTATAFALGAALASPLAGRLVPRLGRTLIVISLAVFMVGLAAAAAVALSLTTRLSVDTLAMVLMFALFIAGLGGGSVVAPNQALSLADVDVREGSTAGGMLQTAQRVGGATGTATLSAIFYTSLRHGHANPHGYALAYASALGVAFLFACVAMFVAIRAARAGRPQQASR